MKIDYLLSKLEPLMPNKVMSWRRVLDVVEPELRGLVEKEILGTTYKALGNYREKLLLSLPTEERSKGSFGLGRVQYESPKWPFGIDQSELLQNMAIFGRSGAGKTNTIFFLLLQLTEKRVSFLFLDWKRTARHLLPRVPLAVYTLGRDLLPLPFNPFTPPPNQDPLVYVNHVVDAIGAAYTLGDAARSILHKAIKDCYYNQDLNPTANDVIDRVKAIPDKERVRGWKASAIRALEALSNIAFKSTSSQEEIVASLLKGHTVVELDALSPSNKKFIVPLLCFWIYSVKLASPFREKLDLVLVIEEAHHFLHSNGVGESMLEMLLRQCREIGIGIIVVDQHPHLMSSAALGNTYTSICLNLKDPRDISRAGSISQISEHERGRLSLLPTGYGVVKLQDRWLRPFLIKIPKVEVMKGSVTDEQLVALSKESFLTASAHSPTKKTPPRESTPTGRIRNLDNISLGEDELLFIEDIVRFPDDGVQARYKRLGFSVDKGNRSKNSLIEKGVVEAFKVKLGRTRKVVLRVKPEMKKLGLLSNNNIDSRASLPHEFWQRWWARRLEREGYKVEIEAPRNIGRADVLATKASESVVVEVETGKSDVVWNVKQDLLSGFQRIIVVATDEAALEKCDSQLAKAELLVNRIQLVLRDQWQK